MRFDAPAGFRAENKLAKGNEGVRMGGKSVELLLLSKGVSLLLRTMSIGTKRHTTKIIYMTYNYVYFMKKSGWLSLFWFLGKKKISMKGLFLCI